MDTLLILSLAAAAVILGIIAWSLARLNHDLWNLVHDQEEQIKGMFD